MRSSRHIWQVTGVLIISMLFLWLPLDQRSISTDEAQQLAAITTMERAPASVREALRALVSTLSSTLSAAREDGAEPLQPVVLASWLVVFDRDEFLLRLPSAWLACLSLGLIYALIKPYRHDVALALLLLSAVTGSFSDLARSINPASLAMTLALLATYLWRIWLVKRRIWRGATYVLIMIAAIHTSFWSLAVLAGHLLLVPRKHRAAFRWMLGMGIVCIIGAVPLALFLKIEHLLNDLTTLSDAYVLISVGLWGLLAYFISRIFRAKLSGTMQVVSVIGLIGLQLITATLLRPAQPDWRGALTALATERDPLTPIIIMTDSASPIAFYADLLPGFQVNLGWQSASSAALQQTITALKNSDMLWLILPDNSLTESGIVSLLAEERSISYQQNVGDVVIYGFD